MRVIHPPAWLVVVPLMVVTGLAARPAPQQRRNDTADAIAEFRKQVSAYLMLQKREESAVSPQQSTPDPGKVSAREKALADRIRAARSTARQGEVFVPAVVPLYKSAFADYYKRRSRRERRLMFDEVPNFTPQVGLTYPATAAKATFPPRLSLELPQLPEELEYRVVGTSLVLRDTKANIVVDFIPSVLPASANPGSPK
jgi:hypothetical protein